MRKGDIYCVLLDDTIGSEQGGYRPVFILSDVMKEKVIVASLTTRKKRKLPVHISLTPNETGLNQESVLLLEQIRPVPKEKLKKKLGTLKSHYKWEEIKRGLEVSLGM